MLPLAYKNIIRKRFPENIEEEDDMSMRAGDGNGKFVEVTLFEDEGSSYPLAVSIEAQVYGYWDNGILDKLDDPNAETPEFSYKLRDRTTVSKKVRKFSRDSYQINTCVEFEMPADAKSTRLLEILADIVEASRPSSEDFFETCKNVVRKQFRSRHIQVAGKGRVKREGPNFITAGDNQNRYIDVKLQKRQKHQHQPECLVSITCQVEDCSHNSIIRHMDHSYDKRSPEFIVVHRGVKIEKTPWDFRCDEEKNVTYIKFKVFSDAFAIPFLQELAKIVYHDIPLLPVDEDHVTPHPIQGLHHVHPHRLCFSATHSLPS